MGQKSQYRGLVADLLPNIRAMQVSGLYLMEYHSENSAMQRLMRKVSRATLRKGRGLAGAWPGRSAVLPHVRTIAARTATASPRPPP